MIMTNDFDLKTTELFKQALASQLEANKAMTDLYENKLMEKDKEIETLERKLKALKTTLRLSLYAPEKNWRLNK